MTKLAVVFPGQGSQSPGMGQDVAAASPRAREVYQHANDVLGLDLAELCFHGPANELERTDVQQPAIFVTSVAIWEALREGRGGEIPMVFAGGLSLGEYTALYATGAVSFEDALRLVHRRGQLMQEAATTVPSGMVSLMGGEPERVLELCDRAREDDVLGPANFNCPGQTVISGSKAACDRAVALAGDFGLRATTLAVAGAFHSSLMAPAARGLREELEKVPFQAPRAPVIANVNAEYHGDAASIRTLLHEQLTHPVLWQGCVERLIRDGAEECWEVGPGRVLTGLIRKINRKFPVTNVSTAESLLSVAEATTAPSP